MRILPIFTSLLLSACSTPPGESGAADPAPPRSTPVDTLESPDTGSQGETGTADTSDLWDVPYEEGCNPLQMHDDCLTPWPSLWHTAPEPDSPTGLRIAWTREQFISPDGELPVDPAITHHADGFSPVSPLLLALGRDVDPAQLSGWGEQESTVQPGAPIALIDLDSGQPLPLLTEMDQSNRALGYEGRHALILRPLSPMRMGGRYAVLLGEELRDAAGAPFTSPPVFEALRDGIPTSDATVEAMRPDYEELFAMAEAAGWPRSGLLLAWEIPVASEEFVLGPARDMRSIALDHVAKQGVSYTVDSVEEDPNEHVAWLIKGSFTPPSFLTEDNSLARDDEGRVVLQEASDWPSYPYTMVVPPVARTQGELALSLFGHGLFGDGESFLDSSSAEELIHPIAAETGAVQIATDWIGLSGSDFSLIVHEVLPNLERVTVVTDRLAQSHINQLVLVELALGALSEDPVLTRKSEDPLLDPGRVSYYGISLGGIQGAGQVSLSPRIRQGVLAVPGAGWSHMIQRSTQFATLDSVIDSLYPDPLTQNVFIAAVQTFFDHSDPANLGLLLHEDPSLPEAPDKTVILQEAIGDCQVPNLATDLLSRTLDARHLEEATDPVYGLPFDRGPATGALLTQIRVPEALEEYFPPDDNTIPEVDNGVHNSAVLQTPTLDQATHLFLSGEAIHPCTGPCDPD